MNAEKACVVIDKWLAQDHPYFWTKSPDSVKSAILEAADNNGLIFHLYAHNALADAETSKLGGSANAGMIWIKQEWKKLRIR